MPDNPPATDDSPRILGDGERMNTVTVTFDPPRSCKRVKESWLITADGEPDLFLPVSQTGIGYSSGDVSVVEIPDYVASTRDFGSARVEGYSGTEYSAEMTRHDYLLLGLTMAFVIRGESNRNAVWEARKLAVELEEVMNQ